MANGLVLTSGCSGGGKSTLFRSLSERGFWIVEEPGRRIVEQELASGGSSLPWSDLQAFLIRALLTSLADFAKAHENQEVTFFDRGFLDAASGLLHLGAMPGDLDIWSLPRYHSTVFMALPWKEVYVTDQERRHDLNAATSEYILLTECFRTLEYDLILLPKTDTDSRADFMIAHLPSSV